MTSRPTGEPVEEPPTFDLPVGGPSSPFPDRQSPSGTSAPNPQPEGDTPFANTTLVGPPLPPPKTQLPAPFAPFQNTVNQLLPVVRDRIETENYFRNNPGDLSALQTTVMLQIRDVFPGMSDHGLAVAAQTIAEQIGGTIRKEPALFQQLQQELISLADLTDSQFDEKTRSGQYTALDPVVNAVSQSLLEAESYRTYIETLTNRSGTTEKLYERLTLNWDDYQKLSDQQKQALEQVPLRVEPTPGVLLYGFEGEAVIAETGEFAIVAGKDKNYTLIGQVTLPAEGASQLDLMSAILDAAQNGTLKTVEGDLVDPKTLAAETTQQLADVCDDTADQPVQHSVLSYGIERMRRLRTGVASLLTLNPTVIRAGMDSAFASNEEIRQDREQQATLEGRVAGQEAAATLVLPFETQVVAIAAELKDEHHLSNAQALDMATTGLLGALGANTPEEATSLIRNMTAADVSEQVAREVEENLGTGIGQVGKTVEPVLAAGGWVLETWDEITHALANSIWETGGAAEAAFTGDWDDGKQHFLQAVEDLGSIKDAFDPDSSVERFSHRVGIENKNLAMVADIVATTLIDPTNLLFAGTRPAAKLTREMVTNPAMGDMFWTVGRGRSWVDEMASAAKAYQTTPTDDGARRIMAVLANTEGLGTARNARHLSELIEAMKTGADAATIRGILTKTLPSHGGDFVGAFSTRLVSRNKVDNIIEWMVTPIRGDKAKQAVRDQAERLFARMSVHRTVDMTDNIVDQIGDIATTIFPDVSDGLKWYEEAAEVVGTGGRLSAARQGELALRQEQITRQLDELAQQLAGHPTPRSLRKLLDDYKLTDMPDTAELIAETQARLDAERLFRQSISEQKKQLRLEEQRIADLFSEAALRDTNIATADLMYRMVDDFAEKINAQSVAANGVELVPKIPGQYSPYAPTVPARDWSIISPQSELMRPSNIGGLKAAAITSEAGATKLAEETVQAAHNVGLLNAMNDLPLPASPYEMAMLERLAKRGLKDDEIRKIADNLRKATLRKKANGILESLESAFSVQVLANPATAFRSNLDEPIRQFLEAGGLAGLTDLNNVKALSASLLASVPGVGPRMARRFVKTSYGQEMRVAEMVGSNPEVTWSVLTRPTASRQLKTWRPQVTRWLNRFTSDDVLRAYAKTVADGDVVFDDVARQLGEGFTWNTRTPRVVSATGDHPSVVPQQFADAWNGTLGNNRRTNTITMGLEGKALDFTDPAVAYESVHNWFELTLHATVDEKMVPKVREILIDVLAGKRGPLDETLDARILNAFKNVPGLDAPNAEGIRAFIYRELYTGPQSVRAGVYTDYWSSVEETLLREAYSRADTPVSILTVDDLVKKGLTPAEAQIAIQNGTHNPVVRQMLEDGGWITEQQLRHTAGRWGQKRAEDILYQYVSQSVAGKAIGRTLTVPFLRANTDYISWYYDFLTRPLTVRISPAKRLALAQADSVAGQAAQKMLTAAESSSTIANLGTRLMRRWSHIQEALSEHPDSTLARLIDEYTFFPTTTDRSMLADVFPGLGPLPTGLYKLLLEQDDELSHAISTAMSDLFPTLEYSRDSAVLDLFFPTSTTSVRNMITDMLRPVAGPPKPGDALAQTLQMVGGEQPRAVSDFEKLAAYQTIPQLLERGVTPGTAEWDDTLVDAMDQAYSDASSKEFATTAVKWLGPFGHLANTFLGVNEDVLAPMLPAFQPVVDRFDTLLAAGLIGENDLMVGESGKPQLLEVWERTVENGQVREDAKYDDVAYLQSALFDAFASSANVVLDDKSKMTLRDVLILENPGMAVMLVSTAMGTRVGPSDEKQQELWDQYVNKDTLRLQNIPYGEVGKDIRRQGKINGWIVDRPWQDWMGDVESYLLRSKVRALRTVWSTSTGVEWPPSLSERRRRVQLDLTANPTASYFVDLVGTEMGITIPKQLTAGDLYDLLSAADDAFADSVKIETFGMSPLSNKLAASPDPAAQNLLSFATDLMKEIDRQGLDFDEIPSELQAGLWGALSDGILAGQFTMSDYDRSWRRYFGNLNALEPPEPPPLSEAELKYSIDDQTNVTVIDGDTINVGIEDGEELSIRLIGLNSPNLSQPGYEEYRDDLRSLFDGTHQIDFVVWKPATYGASTLQAPGVVRQKMWLYVDGVPLFDPLLFSPVNEVGLSGVSRKATELVGDK